MRSSLTLAAALVLAAASAHAEDPMPGMAMPAAGADAGFAAAMAKMHEAMMVAPTGNVDVDFVRGMIPHHQGAIDMAKIELAAGTDPEIRALAAAVVAAQEKEIAEMQAWLARNGQ